MSDTAVCWQSVEKNQIALPKLRKGNTSMFVLVSVILSMVLVQEAHSAECPSKDTVPLRSCSCFEFMNTLVVRCENVNNTGFVETLGKHLNGSVSLTLSNLKVKRIPENFLGDMHVVDLGIHNSTVEDIDSNAFVKQKDYLSSIRITTTSLKIVFTPALQNLVNLVMYVLDQNKPGISLKVISKSDTSTVPAGIHTIDINSYGIESIEADSFTRFQKLTHLTFKSNNLTSLTQNSLPDSLSFIDIRNNHFTEIPVQVLLTLKNVQSIYLMNNKISKLPEESSLKRLLQKNVTLYLDGNPLECSCDLKWYPGYKMNHSSKIYGRCRGNNTRRFVNIGDLTPDHFEQCM